MASKTRALLALGLCLGIGGTAVAAASVADIIHSRQASLKDMGKAFKLINDQLRTGSPDMAAIAAAAQGMKTYSIALPTWFPKGSGPESGVKTGAKAEIWTRSADFAAAAKAYQVEAAKLAAVAGGKDVEALRAEVKAAGAACAGCHRTFRLKES